MKEQTLVGENEDLFNGYAYTHIFDACTSMGNLTLGEEVYMHLERKRRSLVGVPKDGSHTSVALLRMFYALSGIQKASEIFATVKSASTDSVLWTVMMQMHCQSNEMQKAMDLYKEMRSRGIKPDAVAYLTLLTACATSKSVSFGQFLHEHIINDKLVVDKSLATSLVNMYGKFGDFEKARSLFLDMQNKSKRVDRSTWNAMIGACSNKNFPRPLEAMELFQDMSDKGISPNEITYVTLFKTCANARESSYGKSLHSYLKSRNPEFLCNWDVLSSLINMYGRCEGFDAAEAHLSHFLRDLDSPPPASVYNTLISLCDTEERVDDAMRLYSEMTGRGIEPTGATYVSLLTMCANAHAKSFGEAIHKEIYKNSLFDDDEVLNGALINMYGKCGDFDTARSLFCEFKDRRKLVGVPLWNVLFSVLSYGGLTNEAIQYLEDMKASGTMPNIITYTILLNLCTNAKSITNGKKIHAMASRAGLTNDKRVATELIRLYSSCNDFGAVREIFTDYQEAGGSIDVQMWGVTLTACVVNDKPTELKRYFEEMIDAGIKPDREIFLWMLMSCEGAGWVEYGKKIHSLIPESEIDSTVAEALVRMYRKFGLSEECEKIFLANRQPEPSE